MPGLVHPSSDACESISARLSGLEDLRLPAALLRQHPYPDPNCVRAHLQELLQRDAAVFLERYGLLLSAEERQSFEPLRQHYEIDFFLKQAEAAQQQQQQAQEQQQQALPQQHRQRQHLSSTVKNRRLAYMRRLEARGDYFSEHAMREREPLVWQECIGRHEGHPAVPTAAAAGGDRSFAGSLLASYDEAMLQARLQQQIEDEEAAMSEHESDSDADADVGADGRQQQQQQQQQQEQEQGQGGPAAGAAAAAQPRPSSISTPAAAAAGRTQDAARARAAADDAAAAAAAQDPHQQQQQQPGARRAGVDMGPGAMARRRQEFLLEMQHRFLDGLDGEHQDYAAIDADVGLDEDWSKQQAQDAEDAYFDAD